MKINRLETHDRLEHFTKQGFDIGECCQDLINKSPFGDVPFYIFAHARTDEDGVTKRLIWQPRLTKPKSQENSMLFKVFPGTDHVDVIWMIPASELWEQFTKGKMTENQIVCDSIRDYQYNRHIIDMKAPDDLPDWRVDSIYKELSQNARQNKTSESFKLGSLEASLVLKEAQESCQDPHACDP